MSVLLLELTDETVEGRFGLGVVSGALHTHFMCMNQQLGEFGIVPLRNFKESWIIRDVASLT